VGTRWIAAAAHVGPGSITLWALAAVLFLVPLTIAVAALVTKYPGAGGLYLWTRGDFGPWHGFLCAWVYWMGIATWFPSAAMFYMGVAVRLIGLPPTRIYLLGAAVAAIWIALGTNLVGMKIGKWTENVGGAAAWIVSAVFVLLAAMVWTHRGSMTHFDVIPRWNWGTVSFWATIAYAMSGTEAAGAMGGEIRDPERTLPRAGWMAAGLVTGFYAASTAALLVLLPPERISDFAGLTQAGGEAARALSLGWLDPVIALLVVASGMGQLGGLGTSVSRLPFAAAADGLLPKAFARIHPRWHTPHACILALCLVATFLLTVMQLGDTIQAAYQALVSLMVITGFLPYLYIFGSCWKAGHRWSALSGWAVTVMAILCAVIPTAEITSIWRFEAKLAGGTVAVIGSAWLVYRRRAIIKMHP
jgi:amino acid transporter